jgi:hypothetical protein
VRIEGRRTGISSFGLDSPYPTGRNRSNIERSIPDLLSSRCHKLHNDHLKHAGTGYAITPNAPVRMGCVGDSRSVVIILTSLSRWNYHAAYRPKLQHVLL